MPFLTIHIQNKQSQVQPLFNVTKSWTCSYEIITLANVKVQSVIQVRGVTTLQELHKLPKFADNEFPIKQLESFYYYRMQCKFFYY